MTLYNSEKDFPAIKERIENFTGFTVKKISKLVYEIKSNNTEIILDNIEYGKLNTRNFFKTNDQKFNEFVSKDSEKTLSFYYQIVNFYPSSSVLNQKEILNILENQEEIKVKLIGNRLFILSDN